MLSSCKLPDIEAMVDADWAPAQAGYRSAIACDVHWAGMVLGSMSHTQPGTPASSMGERELRALLHRVGAGQHGRHLFENSGFEGPRIKVRSEASAALADVSKLGPGRMRHVTVSSVYVKEFVRRKQVTLER